MQPRKNTPREILEPSSRSQRLAQPGNALVFGGMRVGVRHAVPAPPVSNGTDYAASKIPFFFPTGICYSSVRTFKWNLVSIARLRRVVVYYRYIQSPWEIAGLEYPGFELSSHQARV